MISLYYIKALKAKTVDDIVSVASQHREYLLKHCTQNGNPLAIFDDLNFYSATYECYSIINQTINPFPTNMHLNRLRMTIPVTWLTASCYSHNPAGLTRYLISSFLASIDWAYFLDLILPKLFLSTPLRKCVTIVTIGSAYQYSIFCITQHLKKSNVSIFDNIGTLISILGINLANFGITYMFRKSRNRYLTIIANTIFTFSAALFIQGIMNNGLSSAIDSIVAPLMHKKFNKNDVDYEIHILDYIPNELTCPICYSLLNDPIQCQGHVFCKSCFRTWSSKSNLHPITRKTYHMNEISNEYVFDVLSKKYKEILYQNELNPSSTD